MRIILLFVIFISNSAFSCSCRTKHDVKKSYKYYEIIIAAKVIEIIEPKTDTIVSNDGTILFRTPINGHKIKVELISIYKGKIIYKHITIAPEDSNCEYPFRIGEEYLIYGWLNKGQIETDLCTRTSLLDGNKDLSFLKSKYKKRHTKN
jgi:hypothetical protein